MAERLKPYAGYDVMAKRDSVSFDDITRAVVDRRLEFPPKRRFFSAEEYRLLEGLCARVIPQDGEPDPVPLAPWIDADVFENRGEGFRLPGHPTLRDSWRRLLAGVEAEARARHGRAFLDLDPARQDGVLRAIQQGDVAEASFAGLSAKSLFKDLLVKTIAEVFYSHPKAWSEIGYGGPAAPRGYVRMGLNERDPWEAELAPAPGDGPDAAS